MQDDLFDFLAELNKPESDYETLNRKAINRLEKIIESHRTKDADAINTAKLIFQVTGKLDNKQPESEPVLIIKGGLSSENEELKSGVSIEQWK